MNRPPRIVLIDDNESELRPLSDIVQRAGASCEVRSPDDIDEALLVRADLVVVDHTLDDWVQSLPTEHISRIPLNGVALAAVLRQRALRLHELQHKEFPPTGFALITGLPDTLGPIPSERRPHVISRLNNVEWFWEKKTEAGQLASQMISLARAIVTLPEWIGTPLGTIDALTAYLGVPGNEPLSARFADAIQRCRPPIHHLAKRSHGLVILRWLLHRILPHTAFLVDQLHLAARLGITVESLSGALLVESAASTMLRNLQYAGPLADFDGPRWWRDGVEQCLWDITNGQSANRDAVLSALNDRGMSKLDRVSVMRPVVTVNPDLRHENTFSSFDDVLPLQLDDWPSYAEPAYIRKNELEQHPEMKMYIARDA
jgi:hypothetical protein